MRVLSLNPGSSSLKLALWELGEGEQLLSRGAVEGVGRADASVWLKPAAAGQAELSRRAQLQDMRAAASALFELLEQSRAPQPDAIGQRVVHGGPEHAAPARIDPQLTAALRALVPWAPLHMPGSLELIEAARERYPQLPQVACFDTAFHRQLPERAQRLPLPRALWDRGVRRYGFHGLSYEHCVEQLGQALGSRAIVAHLGSGASLCALLDGKPIDTSMGFSPTGGVPMSTRCGDLDPALLLYLQAEHGYSLDRLSALIERESGLLGISGDSGDVRELLAREAHDPHAAQALELFCYAIRKQIGAYAAALGGIDSLVFTGGVGERAAAVRERVAEPLGFLGIRFDRVANDRAAPLISRADSAVAVRIHHADEDRMIARHTYALCR